MKLLALDVGKRRTGIAYADDAKIPLALDTFQHKTVEELVMHIEQISKERNIEKIILGLPLLPSGEEGAQVQFVRHLGEQCTSHGFVVEYIDERYSTPSLRDPVNREIDPDSASACQILQVYLDRKA